MSEYDLAVIGTGGAGVAGAIAAAEAGARVALIERGTLGGTCVNVGCVPSKTLIRAAEARHRAARVPFAGLETHAGATDLGALVAQKDALVTELRQAKYADVLAGYPTVSLLRGEARFAASGALLLDGAPVGAPKVLLATGSSPSRPAIEGLDQTPFSTSEGLMALDTLPEHLVVIGAGYVAVELGQAFRRLGARVTLIARSRVLGSEDPELGEGLTGYLREEGLDVRLDTEVTRVRHAEGRFSLELRSGEQLTGDRLLVATGRTPNTRGLGLEEVGVALGPDGEVVVDAHLATTNEDVYAAGDVIGEPAFVYVAAHAGRLAARAALGEREAEYDVRIVPRVTFTDPAVASVGRTEREARDEGLDVMVARLPMSHVPRAIAARDTRGFIKLVAERSSRRFLGAQILAPEAGELIQPIVMAMKFGIRSDQLAELLFPYLTAVEGLKLAAQTFDKDISKLSCCAT